MAPSEHQRILKVWILLFFVLHQVYCLLPAPQNVTIVSFNLEHKLIWSPGPGTPTFTHFRVQSYRKKKKQWVSLLNCSDLSTGESCDLTTYFNNPHCYYFARVQAFIPDQESNWTSSKLFYPILDSKKPLPFPILLSFYPPKHLKQEISLSAGLESAILGPPVVECTSCGNCLLLQLSPPPSRGHRRQLEFFFSSYIVNVSRTRDKAQFLSKLANMDLGRYRAPVREHRVIKYS
ncbi:hypothetical protein SRHO_G00113090 [Serrasalmus rhombeus]